MKLSRTGPTFLDTESCATDWNVLSSSTCSLKTILV